MRVLDYLKFIPDEDPRAKVCREQAEEIEKLLQTMSSRRALIVQKCLDYEGGDIEEAAHYVIQLLKELV